MLKFFKRLIMMSTLIFALVAPTTAFAAEIDWDRGVITATGAGAFPPNAADINFAKTYARQAAKLNALQQIAEVIFGIDYEVNDNTIISKSHVAANSAITRGTKVVSQRMLEGGYEVTMEIPLFGKDSAAVDIFSEFKNASRESFPRPTTTISANTKYTGLIVDCRGLGLHHSMSPIIKNTDDISIYSIKNLDYNLVINQGMVSYTKDINKATRAGKNPLIVKAVAINGISSTNPMVSVADSDKILSANQTDGFLNKCAVVFVY